MKDNKPRLAPLRYQGDEAGRGVGMLHVRGGRWIRRCRLCAGIVALCVSVLGLGYVTRSAAQNASTEASPGNGAPSIAFYYGAKPPVAELQAFDMVVVEPDSGFDPRKQTAANTQWLGYISLGEVLPSRAYFKSIPQAWLVGSNTAWNSHVVDQAAPEWPAFYVDQVITPLWQRGYRGFFLDTLDSYQLVAKTDAERRRQEAGMVAVIRAIKARYPEAQLVLNRGFEILPEVHTLVHSVAFESLFRGWDQASNRYTEVSSTDRDWLLAQAKIIRETYRLPAISIDYCPPADRACARDTAAQIKALGIVPYVSDPAFSSIGIGQVEVMPRRVLVVLDYTAETSLDDSAGARMLAMPLNHLGYRVEFANVSQPLPEGVLTDRYAGVVVWLNNSTVPQQARYADWIRQQIGNGVRVAFMGQFGMSVDGVTAQMLGLNPVRGRPTGALEIASRDPMMGFETEPVPDRRAAVSIKVGADAKSLLRLRSGQYEIDAAAITKWGGYVLAPYTVFTMDDVDQNRWVVQPLDFLRQALALPQMPVPDVTTENGRRLMLVHIDGDGFASRAEFPGAQYGGNALFKDILERYRVPTTMSIIEGEVSEAGLYPKLASTLEPLARKFYELPYVEVASHSYSHPYDWARTVPTAAVGADDVPFHLEIPGYRMDLDREISGSINYINRALAPASKKVKIFLWTGDCQPPADAVRKAYAAGVLNMNGGDTLISRSNPSWTAIAPLGLNKGEGAFQVFAPNQNENIYTNEWTGPYYGFERVIETFEMTDKPIRFKPLNIYYHTYSGTKAASMRALRKVYDYALSQPVMPIYASDYIRKVLDFENMAVARDGNTWVIRSNGNLRTVRWAGQGQPQLTGSKGVAGFSAANAGQGSYIHLDGGNARFAMGNAAPAVPYVAEANGAIRNLVRSGSGMQFDFRGDYKPFVRFSGAQQCRVTVDGVAKSGSRIEIEASEQTSQNFRRVHVDCAG